MTTKAERSLDRKVQEQKARIEALEDLVRVVCGGVPHGGVLMMTPEQKTLFAEVMENG